MRSRTLVVSVLILIGLAGYYYYFELYLPGLEDEARHKAYEIFDLQGSDITEISISTEQTIALSKKDSSWRMTAPLDVPADVSEMDGLISAITSLRAQRFLTDAGSLAELGLDPRGLTLTFATPQGKFFLHVGGQTPSKQCCYARSSTRDDVFLIDTYEKTNLDKDVFSLRDKHLFSLNYGDVEQIRVARHGLILEFLKDAQNRWQLPENPSKRLKAAKIDNLLQNLFRLQAQAFPEEYAVPGDPDTVIEITAEGATQSLQAWQLPLMGKNIYAFSQRLGQMVQIRDCLPAFLPNDLMEVMDRSIVSIDPGRAQEITVSGPENRMFVRRGEAWYTGNERLEAPLVVQSFVGMLNRLEYVDQYMKLPDDLERVSSVRITYAGSPEVFDITMYSRYYITVGDQVYQLHEGGMKEFGDSLAMLIKSSDG